MKQKVYNLIILDESGSMQLIAEQAVSGLNETLQSIVTAHGEHEDQEHYVSFVTFNSARIRTVMDRRKVEVGKKLSWTDFFPNNCTPLFDAMEQSISELRRNISDDDVVLVTIITDGMENASKEYNGAAIKKMVSDLKEKGWLFVYIGTNQDVDAVADSMGIRSRQCFEYSDTGAQAMLCEERTRRRRFYGDLSRFGKSILEEDSYDYYGGEDVEQTRKEKEMRDKTAMSNDTEDKKSGGLFRKIRSLINK